MNNAKQYLIDNGIKPSVQRIAIMKYLFEHRTHPTVDDIFHDLHDAIPTLSKTTVYNTLKLFSEKGAILSLTIDEKKFDSMATNNDMLIFVASGVTKCSIYPSTTMWNFLKKMD